MKKKVVGRAQPKVRPKQYQQPVVKCKIYGKPHPTVECWHNPDNKKVVSRDQDRNFGRSDQSL